MNYKNAHAYFEEKQREMTNFRSIYTEKDIEINGLAILAIEKQIPKKPMNCNGERMCECGNIVKSYHKFCYECGQALY